jgi:DNA-binding XRE family transcriptional regulator
VRTSTIAKHRAAGAGTPFALALGEAIRDRRRELGLSQEALARPLSKTFVSLLEHGRLSPSLASLILLCARLDVTPWDLLRDVNERTASMYTPGCGPSRPFTRRRGPTPGAFHRRTHPS